MRARSLAALLCVLTAPALSAEMPAKTDSVGYAADFRYHWRVRPHGKGAACWGVAWNIVDSTCYDGAELRVADARHIDSFDRESAELVVYSVRDGVRSDVATHSFSPAHSMHDRGGSLMLELFRDGDSALLKAGATTPDVVVAAEIKPCTRIGGYALSEADTIADSFRCTPIPAPEFAPFADVAALLGYLRQSSDPREGLWRYHDRDTDPLRVSIGGDYRFATVSDGCGGYMLVHLEGAEDAAGWPPLRIKARLTPTGFIDEFDLQWLDAAGEPMGEDCSAEYTDGSLLKFSFPLYKSSVRYRRYNLP